MVLGEEGVALAEVEVVERAAAGQRGASAASEGPDAVLARVGRGVGGDPAAELRRATSAPAPVLQLATIGSKVKRAGLVASPCGS